jgi:uncharacterized protein YqkB
MAPPTKPFGVVPATARIEPEPLEVHFDDQAIEDMKTLIRLSPVAKETYENRDPEGGEWEFGVPRSWMVEAKRVWSEEFDWYAFSLYPIQAHRKFHCF